MRVAVTKAIEHRRKEDGNAKEKAEKLRLDILNGPSHVFGEHLHCKSRGYFCNGPKEGWNINYCYRLTAGTICLYEVVYTFL